MLCLGWGRPCPRSPRMMNHLKAGFKQSLRSLGFDLVRLPGPEHYRFFPRPEDRYRWIQGMGIRVILDVGAHTGESALHFHGILPEARIISFEPIRRCFLEMRSRFQGQSFHQAYNYAIGAATGTGTMHRSGYSPSSSLLPMGSLHKDAYPFSADGTAETIEVRRLDSLAPGLSLEKEVLLKIDTQGYEKQVLLGARDLLEEVKLVIVETSFEELYRSQPRFPEIYRLLSEAGFEYCGSWDQFHHPRDGRPLQQDGIFMRRES